jgi:hypothetical protein
MTIRLPAWLEAIIAAIAGYLRGRIDQANADEVAAKANNQAAEKTVEDAAREVGAMTDDDVQKELGQWRRP